ncbi:MAG TPA: phosphoribosylformylglycinamidine synthase subunit PurS [Tepidisphaeraceae bacterium]|jgi:phosphoribosylformylglycinamidine synthase|nr:phosphoribosylformylglycinamidine synthase subunit PurS [Tepidisphaeraceae bacterium]
MIYRIDVRARDGIDPLGVSVCQQIRDLGKPVASVQTSRIFLLDTDADHAGITRIARELLADPIVESAEIFNPRDHHTGESRIEVHLKPGVMDPVAASTEMAVRDLGLPIRQVRTGRAYLIDPTLDRRDLEIIAARVLANGVIESVHFDPYCPAQFETGRESPLQVRQVALRDLSDSELSRLSRDGHLFLSLDEMKAIQNYFRKQNREPTDIELETVAQTWSEHCVHKTLKSPVDVEIRDEQNRTISTRRYANLIKETIFASTRTIEGGDSRDPFCLSVFTDNAGAVAFDETDAVCFKVETHNHPSAIEPYGGSATGAGGVIRDILGTGLAAKPIANTDVFCVAHPDTPRDGLPRGVIHPRRILHQIVAGVRDYGNRMGIPTVNGAVYFDDRYLGNPLVFCGCVGLIPRDKLQKAAQNGDAIVVMGGRTGRDGIHGATFSSAELTDTHADEFSHAVQIGNAITEKKMADVILTARDQNLFDAITDCGAGGLSSAVGEMAEKTGAIVDLEKVPLKYTGLRYDEIWISEAQERMVLAVPPQHVPRLLELAQSEDVEATVIGQFGTNDAALILNFRGQQVGRVSMQFLHNGIPMPTRKAIVAAPSPKQFLPTPAPFVPDAFKRKLLSLLAHPNIASKHWIIRQYDHEVQGGSVVKPLVGPMQIGPSDAAVLRPKLGSSRGVAIGCGLAPQIEDPYDMAIASIDEAIRNVVAVGAHPDRVAILDNFCWPSVDDERTMGTLVRACEACRDAAIAYGIPFISGKDSLNNQFTNKETGQVLRIPRTLLISAIGVIEDVRKCVTMDFKLPGAPVYLISTNSTDDLAAPASTHRAMAGLIADGHVASVHDLSDGGLAVTAAEMIIASGRGLTLDPAFLAASDPFAERPGSYIIELRESVFDVIEGKVHPTVQGQGHLYGGNSADPFQKILSGHFGSSASVTRLGFVQNRPSLLIVSRLDKGIKVHDEIPVEDLTRAWRGTLDW